MQPIWHTQNSDDILATLDTTKQGLTNQEAGQRLIKYGPNKLPETRKEGYLTMLARQFKSPLIYLLVLAAVIIYFSGHPRDTFIIGFILLFNAIVGAIQEGRAQNTLLSLNTLVNATALVLRDHKEIVLPDSEIVPGDIIILQEGDKIPADARLLSINDLKVDESTLTGESLPVEKTSEILEAHDAVIAEQKNMVFKGTHVVGGSAKAIVVSTGLSTVIGGISTQISQIHTEDPLQKGVRKLARYIVIIVALISGAVFIIGILRGLPPLEMLATVISLSVSVIPEGLPIVMTLVLATGVWRMSKQNALVKKLQAVESLGQANIIAVDKTGTLTKNEMTVQTLFIDNKHYAVSGSGYDPSGIVTDRGGDRVLNSNPGIKLAGTIAVLCAQARVTYSETAKIWQVAGDPTEAAILVFAQKLGIARDETEQDEKTLGELPFSSRTKYHAKLQQDHPNNLLAVVGAPEIILESADKVWRDNKAVAITADERQHIDKQIAEMSAQGLRVLGLAYDRTESTTLSARQIKNLTFVGLVGIIDTLRPEVHEALDRAREAGIKVIMITGDHIVTAQAIGEKAGIFQKGDTIITGQEIESLDDAGLAERIKTVSVFARVTPEHKLRIIQAYRLNGNIIAMTGDGVNDAPSLVAADLGVAMGKVGTEVAKEAADIILLDDNFGSIVKAVEEGRSIYRTIKKVILYLFSTNAGEVLAISGGLILGWPIPLLATQIIWLNFVTDGFLDVSLAMEPKDENLLRKKFESTGSSLVDSLMLQRIILMSVTMAIGTLILFHQYIAPDMTSAWTISLTTLAVFQWFNAWNCRSHRESVFTMNPFSNIHLIGATLTVAFLQVLAVYNPWLQTLLHTRPLTLSEWGVIIVTASSIIVVEEIRKLIVRRRSA